MLHSTFSTTALSFLGPVVAFCLVFTGCSVAHGPTAQGKSDTHKVSDFPGAKIFFELVDIADFQVLEAEEARFAPRVFDPIFDKVPPGDVRRQLVEKRDKIRRLAHEVRNPGIVHLRLLHTDDWAWLGSDDGYRGMLTETITDLVTLSLQDNPDIFPGNYTITLVDLGEDMGSDPKAILQNGEIREVDASREKISTLFVAKANDLLLQEIGAGEVRCREDNHEVTIEALFELLIALRFMGYDEAYAPLKEKVILFSKGSLIVDGKNVDLGTIRKRYLEHMNKERREHKRLSKTMGRAVLEFYFKGLYTDTGDHAINGNFNQQLKVRTFKTYDFGLRSQLQIAFFTRYFPTQEPTLRKMGQSHSKVAGAYRKELEEILATLLGELRSVDAS